MLKQFLTLTAAAGLLSASAVELSNQTQWESRPGLTFSQQGMTLTSNGYYHGKVIRFSPGKKYVFSGEFRLTSDKGKITGRIALMPLAGKNEIHSMNVSSVSGTDTVLVSAARKGATEIVIKNGAKWKKIHCIQFNSKTDFSDLPNFDTAYYNISSIEKKGENYLIAFAKPLRKDYPAGTALRQSARGNAFVLGRPDRAKDNWIKFGMTIYGESRGGIAHGKFWPGMTAGKLQIWLNCRKSEGAALQIRNFKLTEIEVPRELSGTEKIEFSEKLTNGVVKNIPDTWKLQKRFGSDFIVTAPSYIYRKQKTAELQKKYDENLYPGLYIPFDSLPAHAKKIMDIPAFRNIVPRLPYVDHSAVKTNKDGTWTFKPERFKMGAKLPKGKRYVLGPQRFVRPYRPDYVKYCFNPANFKNDIAAWKKWKKANPEMLYMTSLSEWVNESNFINHRARKWQKRGILTAEQVAATARRFPEKVANRDEFVNLRLKQNFDRIAGVLFNDPSALSALDGAWCVNHLAAEWGSKFIISETTRPFVLWQLQMIFHRGTARQFGIPWGWYVASYYTGNDINGKRVVDAEPTAYFVNKRNNPDAGLSMSIRKRAFYMTWLSGANQFEREDTDRNWWMANKKGRERWTLGPEAKVYIDFYNFTQKHDRGVPYAPVALLVARNRGVSRTAGRAFERFRYLKSDNTLDAFVTSMYPRPSRPVMEKYGIERSLVNTPYGDMFDVLTPDFKDNSNLKKSLPSYPVAVLIGDYPELPQMSSALKEYVKGGGVLVLNAAQLDNRNFDSSFTGVKSSGLLRDGEYLLSNLKLDGAGVLAKAADGSPLFTVNRFGKGKVIVAAARHLVPDYDDNDPQACSRVLGLTFSGKYNFKYVRALLGQLRDELLPFRVNGNIQYGFNRTKKGWLVYFLNNNGVTKFATTPATFDMSKTAKVELVSAKGEKFKAVELLSGKTLSDKGDRFDLSVEPGKFAIVDISL